jgi:hypothetical protein
MRLIYSLNYPINLLLYLCPWFGFWGFEMAGFGWASWVAGFVFAASVAVGEDGDPMGEVAAPSGKPETFEWVEGGAK